MQKIGVLIEDMFEDSEYAQPAKAFLEAQHELIHIGVKKGTVKGEKTGMEVKIDKIVNDLSVDDLDAMFIPGGYSPDRLRVHDDIVAFVKKFVRTGKPVFFICHGAQLLITADVLRGRKATGWKSIAQDIKNAGARFLDQDMVEDDNFISSRSPSDLPAFIKACLRKLAVSRAGSAV